MIVRFNIIVKFKLARNEANISQVTYSFISIPTKNFTDSHPFSTHANQQYAGSFSFHVKRNIKPQSGIGIEGKKREDRKEQFSFNAEN